MYRTTHFETVGTTEELFKRFGRYFDSQKHSGDREEILDTLVRHFPDNNRRELSHAMDTIINTRHKGILWPDFFCLILSLLRGRWIKVTNNPGFAGGISGLFLMTDGTILVQEYRGARWKKLTPDSTGSYVNGSWSDIAPMKTARLYYASAVLADGRLLICGGEYEGSGGAVESNKCEIYDPRSDTWSDVTPPPGWTRIGDAACALLPDGRFLLGNLDDTRTALFDPATNTFTAGPTKFDDSSEESWVLLPDGTVVTVHTDASRTTEKYVLASNSWVSAGNTPFLLPEISSKEIGAGVLLPNGKAFFIGATNQTALYTMPTNPSGPGTWASGPTFPNDASGTMIGAKDAPACLLTNGRVLCAVGPVDGVAGDFLAPTSFYEFDGSSLQRVDDPPTASKFPYNGRMLLLPNGQVLFGNDSQELYVYSYGACINNSWRPTINYVSTTLYSPFTYTITGTQLNGLSQAVGYGDDFTAATNYPLIRLKKVGENKVYYARSFNHSTMAVATGNVEHSTNFKLPSNIESGEYDLSIVANGIPSFSKRVSVHKWIIHWPDFAEFNRLFGSLADGPLWVWGPNGPIPVDPWGPKYREDAEKLRKELISAFMGLKRLGLTLHQERLEFAQKQAGPLVFEELEIEAIKDQPSQIGETRE